MRGATVAGLLLVEACAAAPAAWAPTARLDPSSCAAPPGTPGTPWRLVTAEGFTFCVPSDWQSADGRTWRIGGAFIGWCTRTLAQCPQVNYQISGRIIRNPNEIGAAALENEGESCGADNSDEVVGGLSAVLSDWHCNGRHITEAYWRTPPIYFFGETEDAVMARLQLQVYRTVRFVPSAQP